jgi:hypothetical protein
VLRLMTPAELAWLSAIIEGEGTYVLRRAHGVLRVVMTDRDIIERLVALSGVGLMRRIPPRQPHHKPVWAWDVVRYEAAILVAEATAPLLLERRRLRVATILERCDRSLPPVVCPQRDTPQGWAWVAGLIEGEGWIGPSPQAKRRSAVIGASSTDRDVLDRLHDLTGVGSIYTLKLQKPTHKQGWQWSVSNRRDVHDVLEQILPLLGSRRAERARHVLTVT